MYTAGNPLLTSGSAPAYLYVCVRMCIGDYREERTTETTPILMRIRAGMCITNHA